MKIMYYLKLAILLSNAHSTIWPSATSNGLKTKTDLTNDVSSYGNIFKDIPEWNGFQLNFSGQPIELGKIPNTKTKEPALLIGFPIIGHYRGEGYDFFKRLALIQFDPKTVIENIPQSIEQELLIQLKVGSAELRKKLESIDIRFNAIALGEIQEPQFDSPDKSYNVVFHFWGGLWHKLPENIVDFYSDTFNVGIFEPYGVRPKYIKFNTIGPIEVNWHAPEHISPDNARLFIEPNHHFVSFWALAVAQDKKHISITYFLIAYTSEAEKQLAKALFNAKNLVELKKNIDTIENQKVKFTDSDIQSLHNWVDMVLKIADPKLYVDTITKEVLDLSRKLAALKSTIGE